MILCIDTETTGLDPVADDVIQIGVVIHPDEGKDQYIKEYIKPRPELMASGWADAERVNHISPEMVAEAAPLKDFLPRLQELVDEAETLVLYNAGFDLSFLERSGLTYDIEKVVDVMEDFAVIYGDWSDYYQRFKWKPLWRCAAAYGYQWSKDVQHDALEDAKATLHCYLAMKPTLAEKIAEREESMKEYFALMEQ